MAAFQVDEESIFDVARRINESAAQSDYLQQACGDNVELRQRIEGMLKVDAAGDSFFESPPPGIDPTVDIPKLTEKAGDTIGAYKLLQQIGEGGFGVVYLAEQVRPVRRKVALKVIKPGMDTKEVIGRFEAERQALALMDHPNIAKVFDAGATATGRPYFVMELVKGIPLVQFCDENNMSNRQRLELFISVCHAIQHAHQKGIIHRDLKPSNVMVTIHDNKPVAKVIDFGVSKAISQQLTERTLFTAYGQMVGTPVYMSPEQAQMSGLDIDTRSDIYSLGVMLFELLTGSTPLDAERLRKSGYAEMQRLIREEESPKPSDRLSTQHGEALAQIAKHRSTEPSQLNRQVQGDLDWIVMKALEKDRNRRYETANGFLSDVERYLNNESVLACPPTTAYRLRKFISRNRQAVLMAGSIAAALLLAIAGLSMGYLRAHHSAKEARLAWKNVSQEQARTEKERDRAEKQRRLAVEKSQQLEVKNTEINRNLYAAQMVAAAQALESPDGLGRVRHLTDNWRPQPGQDDLRGWEWYYLRSKLDREWKSFSNSEGFVFWNSGGVRRLEHNPEDGSLTIRNADTGVVLVALPENSVEPDPSSSRDSRWWASRLSQDGKWLASEHSDGTIRIYDLQAGRLANTLTPQGKSVVEIALSSDGALVATTDEAHDVTVWECLTGRITARIATDQLMVDTNRRFMPDLFWSPDGLRVAMQLNEADKLYVFGTGADQDLKLTIPDVPSNVSVAWRPDSEVMAIVKVTGDKRIWLMDASTGVELSSFPIEHQRFATQLAWDPDGRRLATGSHDKTVKLWDTETLQQLATFRGHAGAIRALNWSPDGSYLISHANDGVKIWDINSNTDTRAVITGTGWVPFLRWSPDSNRLAWKDEGQITLWDVSLGKAVAYLPAAGPAFAWSPDPDGSYVAYGSYDKTIPIWHNKSHEVVGSMAGHDQRLAGLSWIPGRIASGGSDQVVKLWDAKTRKLIDEHHLHEAEVSTVALNRNGEFLASGGYDQWLHVWDVKQRKSVFSHRYNSRVRQVAWSPVDERVAVAVGKEVVHVFDMQDRNNDLQLRGHTNSVGNIAWSPDGSRIASGGKDRTVKIWDTETGRELVSFALPQAIASMDWSPDGQKIAAGIIGVGEVMVWDASHGYRNEHPRVMNEETRVRTSD